MEKTSHFSDQKQLKGGWHQLCWPAASSPLLEQGWEVTGCTSTHISRMSSKLQLSNYRSEASRSQRYKGERISLLFIKTPQTGIELYPMKQASSLRGSSEHMLQVQMQPTSMCWCHWCPSSGQQDVSRGAGYIHLNIFAELGPSLWWVVVVGVLTLLPENWIGWFGIRTG